MPKNKGPRQNRRTTLSLPERIALQRREAGMVFRAQIMEERNDAARTALMYACVSLNNTEGMGITRLVRFARELQGNLREHYESVELLDYHRAKLEERMGQLGFMVRDGHIYGVYNEETGKTVKHKETTPVDYVPEPHSDISLAAENDYLRAELAKALARVAELEGAKNEHVCNG